MGKNVGGKLRHLIPLPGFTENIQRYVLKKWIFWMQMVRKLPSGNPNLIKMAREERQLGIVMLIVVLNVGFY
jgi:hypothetical protein